MSVIDRLASAQNRNDEEPNIALAQALADDKDHVAIAELVTHLGHKDKAIQSDCIKVLYEIGAIQPELIADYVDDFVVLISPKTKNNRLTWGGMTALGAIAPLRADEIWQHIDTVVRATQDGSAITQDWGVRVLATVSADNPDYEARIFPVLLDFLANCRPKDLPRHSESVLVAVNTGNRDKVVSLLKKRLPTLKPSQAKRVEKTLRLIDALDEDV